MANKDIIAIGGSAGSGPAIKRLLAGLPPDLPASLFVATHVPSRSPGYLAETLQGAGPLAVSRAVDGQAIERGHVYVAEPDRHLLLIDGTIRLGDGPRENMARPAIDPLFRSAALSYGSRAVGVVLSGMLNDGASGLYAIKAVGGTAVVQHPLDAQADQMPLAALEAVEADHVAGAAELGRLLADIAGSTANPTLPPPESLALEVEIAAGDGAGSDELRRFATPAAITCPECHGVLSEVNGQQPLRYRCQIGHAVTAETMVSRAHEVDEAIRVAMRVMEERLTLVERMAKDARDTGRFAVAELYEERAKEYRGYASTLREAALMAVRMGRPMRQQEF